MGYVTPSRNSKRKPRPSPPAQFLLWIIKAYRLLLSPVIRIFVSCRHWPTCSQYGLDAVVKHGAFRGGYLTIRRILRCNPLFPGGYDPVP